MPEDEAKGYGLWVAKVVAARRFARARAPGGQAPGGQPEPERRGMWHELEGWPQTDAPFDAEVVARMGPEFYREVFVPAIQQARAHGRAYEAIRDAIRRPWRPA